ncbi:flavin reductase family protein [Candidatus Micrarchaeota archaeon]|nr:flavin reductase family protein [Candidatus Micrarchaeota archaeon]
MEKMYHLLYPMRVCLITSKHEEKESIMAASWVFPLSMDPPLFGLSVAEKRYSCDLIRKGKAFGINIPHAALEEAMIICGTNSGRDVDKFEKANLTRDEGKKIPLIQECPVSIECELVEEHKTGDHILFVGKAIEVRKRFEEKGLYQVRGMEFTSL